MLPTQKLYQTVDRTQYEEIKQRHVNALPQGYGQLANRDKWQRLMDQFAGLMPEDAATIQRFCQARLNTVEGAGNISLADCISYFEQFYFLYTTTEPLFKLDDAEKKALKVLLLDVMGGGACEPGKQERFESALALYRRDTNWINGHLSQARYHVLEGLAERCNVELQIGNGFSPHTIKFMKGLRDAKQLGIDREAALTDIYGGVQRVPITDYFTSHYQAAFHEYEASAVHDLSHQLLNEFTDFLRGKVSIDGWELDTGRIIIPLELIQEFNRFFESKSFDAVMDDLGDDSDELNLKLKKKADFEAGIRSLVKKKLLQNGYYVPISNLHALPSHGMPALPTWHGGAVMQDLVAVAQALENPPEDLPAILNQYTPVLLQYPLFLLAHVERNPAIIAVLPQAFRANTAFIDDVLTAVNGGLLTAIEAGDTKKTEQLIGCLLVFLPSTYGDFSKLSERVLNDPTVALALVFNLLQKTIQAFVASLWSILKLTALSSALMGVLMIPGLLGALAISGAAFFIFWAETALLGAFVAHSPLLAILNLVLLAPVEVVVLMAILRLADHLEITFGKPLFDHICFEWTQLCDSLHAVGTNACALVAGIYATVFLPAEPQSVYGFFAQARATTTDSIVDQRPVMGLAA